MAENLSILCKTMAVLSIEFQTTGGHVSGLDIKWIRSGVPYGREIS